jgi:hypothetical protein
MNMLKSRSNTTKRYGLIVYNKNKEWFVDFYFRYTCWLIALK